MVIKKSHVGINKLTTETMNSLVWGVNVRHCHDLYSSLCQYVWFFTSDAGMWILHTTHLPQKLFFSGLQPKIMLLNGLFILWNAGLILHLVHLCQCFHAYWSQGAEIQEYENQIGLKPGKPRDKMLPQHSNARQRMYNISSYVRHMWGVVSLLHSFMLVSCYWHEFPSSLYPSAKKTSLN